MVVGKEKLRGQDHNMKGLSVIYYNAAMTNIPISRHFCFLSPMENHATGGDCN
jgi:hypothetical protein